MAWNMLAVEAPSSSIRVPLDQIPQDVIDGVEEGFTYCTENPTERVVVAFETEKQRDETRMLVRSYCEVRKAGKLTASIWAVSANPETGETEKDGSPALSMAFKPYQKKERKTDTTGEKADGENPAE